METFVRSVVFLILFHYAEPLLSNRMLTKHTFVSPKLPRSDIAVLAIENERPQVGSRKEIDILLRYKANGFSWNENVTLLNKTPVTFSKSYEYSLGRAAAHDLCLNDLLFRVTLFGEDWPLVASEMNSLPGSCRYRYRMYLKSFKENQPWSNDEDNTLRQLYIENLRDDTTAAREVCESEVYKLMQIMHPDNIEIAQWRNISHFLKRSSYDCRRRYSLIGLGINLEKSQDVWYLSETLLLAKLIQRRGKRWSEFARELGRTKMQCYNCYCNTIEHMLNQLQKSKESNDLHFAESDMPFKYVGSNVLVFFDENPLKLPPGMSENEDTFIDSHIHDVQATEPSIDSYSRGMSSKSVINLANIKVVASHPAKSNARAGRSSVWSFENDRKLVELVQRYGNKWKRIGEELGNMPGPRCFQRYKILSLHMQDYVESSEWSAPQGGGHSNHTNVDVFPRGDHDVIISSGSGGGGGGGGGEKVPYGWTVAQNEELCELVRMHGPRWTRIGRQLGRTAYVCRAAFKRLVDRQKARVKISAQSMSVELEMPKYRDRKLHQNMMEIISSAGVNGSSIPQRSIHQTRPNVSVSITKDTGNGNGISSASSPMAEAVLECPTESQQSRDSTIVDFGPEGSLELNAYATVDEQLWTKSADDQLKQLVDKLGRRWTSIAEIMQRSPEDVMLRYDFKITRRKARPWGREEDKTLVQLVQQLGTRWATIGDMLGRGGAQCSLRYRLTLDPRLKWRLWAPDEDSRLISLREQRGYNWAMISATMDRSSQSCRYRYLKLRDPRGGGAPSDDAAVEED